MILSNYCRFCCLLRHNVKFYFVRKFALDFRRCVGIKSNSWITGQSALGISGTGFKFNTDSSQKPGPENYRKVVEQVDGVKKENIFTIPNALCVSRIALSPVLGYYIINGAYEWGLAIFIYAAVTDVLDGWIARSFPGQLSVLGSLLDPVADKILVGTLVLSLTYVGLIPVPLTILIIARDIGLMAAGFILRFMTLDPPRTLSRYFDVTTPSVQMKPTGISKFNTFVQLCLFGVSLTAPIFNFVDHTALHVLWYFTAGTTIASALSYVFGKNTYDVLRKRTIRGPSRQ